MAQEEHHDCWRGKPATRHVLEATNANSCPLTVPSPHPHTQRGAGHTADTDDSPLVRGDRPTDFPDSPANPTRLSLSPQDWWLTCPPCPRVRSGSPCPPGRAHSAQLGLQLYPSHARRENPGAETR